MWRSRPLSTRMHQHTQILLLTMAETRRHVQRLSFSRKRQLGHAKAESVPPITETTLIAPTDRTAPKPPVTRALQQFSTEPPTAEVMTEPPITDNLQSASLTAPILYLPVQSFAGIRLRLLIKPFWTNTTHFVVETIHTRILRDSCSTSFQELKKNFANSVYCIGLSRLWKAVRTPD